MCFESGTACNGNVCEGAKCLHICSVRCRWLFSVPVAQQPGGLAECGEPGHICCEDGGTNSLCNGDSTVCLAGSCSGAFTFLQHATTLGTGMFQLLHTSKSISAELTRHLQCRVWYHDAAMLRQCGHRSARVL